MKFLKYPIVAFALTFMLSALSVNALTGYQAYAGITLPRLNEEVIKGPHSKTEAGIQRYHNFSTINSCTGNNNIIAAKVYSEAKGYSQYMAVSVGATSSWANNDKTNGIRAYNIHLKNNTFSPCTATHSGEWFLNPSIS